LIISKKITVLFCVVRGPGAVQLVTSPADQADVSKVAVFDVENCRLTCFSRSGHQFVITNKDEFVIKVDISKLICFIFLFSIQVYCCNTRKVLYSLPKRKINSIEYSPQDTYLLLFEPFTSM